MISPLFFTEQQKGQTRMRCISYHALSSFLFALLTTTALGQPDTKDEKAQLLLYENLLKGGTNIELRLNGAAGLEKLGTAAKPAARSLCHAMLDKSGKLQVAAANALEKVYPELHAHVVALNAD